MGDSFLHSTYADLQRNSNAHFVNHHEYNDATNGAPASQNEEEPYTIKCVCRFVEDDGSTVLCENCNTWQHIQCYYFPGLVVPDVHQCVDCSPRAIDAVGASQRQRRLLEPLRMGEDRKPKRSGPRGGRKSKVKDSNHTSPPHNPNFVNNSAAVPFATNNGWSSAELYGQDRKSGSPKDQPPPNKRIKTAHTQFALVEPDYSVPEEHTLQSERSMLQSVDNSYLPRIHLAECPPNYFSVDFIRTHQTNTDFTPADANLYLDIGVSNILSSWLDDVDLFAAATNGRTHEDVFQHFPQPIEELESPISKRVHKDTSVEFHGGHPTWPYVTVEKDLFNGDLVGELRGSIGLQGDYKSDPANRWEKLRHPDHFVFFHPILPIYIDCRSEGTLLRYARRSCRPNMKLETLITGAREYRFCFTATADIPAGSELTIAWDTGHDQQLQESLSRASTLGDTAKDYVRTWVETILAHFGGCACEKQLDAMCWMAHFDRRLDIADLDKSNIKPLVVNRRRGQRRRTPTSTSHATNSRASSEAVVYDHPEADLEDPTSSSRSVRSASIVLGAQDEVVGPGNELSAREKRKLLQQEKLFDKLEQNEHQGSKRKKRSSGSYSMPSGTNTNPHGSSASTNADSMPGRGGLPDMSSSNNSQNGTPANLGTAFSKPSKRTSSFAVKPRCSRPIYVDASTQTSPDNAETPRQEIPPQRKPYMSLSQRLLKRAAQRKVHQMATLRSIDGLATSDETMDESNRVVTSNTGLSQSLPDHTNAQNPYEDVNMADDSASPQSKTLSSPLASNIDAVTQAPLRHSHSPIQPLDPPWDSSIGQSVEQQLNSQPHTNPPQLHVESPPPSLLSATSAIEPHVFATPSAMSLSLRLSPSGHGADFQQPSLVPLSSVPSGILASSNNSVTQPSPLKKKMSLSDYMNKRKSETPAADKLLANAPKPGDNNQSSLGTSANHIPRTSSPPQ